jgi:hypothetical protein
MTPKQLQSILDVMVDPESNVRVHTKGGKSFIGQPCVPHEGLFQLNFGDESIAPIFIEIEAIESVHEQLGG